MVTLGVLTSISLIFSYIESLFPVFIPVPGIKLGLANIVVLLTLLLFGVAEAFAVGIVRILLSALLFGNLISLFMAFSGFLASFCFMVILKKSGKFSVPGISVGGGVLHNFGQLLAAFIYIGNRGLFSLSLYFTIFGILTGLITGFLCKMIYERVDRNDWLSKG